MYFKMLKKDLKRKKSMNLILLTFIFLATMFIAGSLSNMAVILNGTESFFDKAGISDFLIITMEGSGENKEEANQENQIESFLKNDENVSAYNRDSVLFFSGKQFSYKDEKKEYGTGTTGFITSYDVKQQKFFDENDNEITSIEKGTMYVNLNAVKDADIKAGDILVLTCENGFKKEFKVNGYCKDALFGTDLMGSHRFVLCNEDYEELEKESGLPYGYFYSVDCVNQKAFEKDYNNAGLSVIFSGNRNLIKTTYIMDMVIAAVLLLVSLCLIIISVIMLKFTIVFTINEDYKEIGIMKAIGLKDNSIRILYVTKYFAISVIGSILGFIASIPFSSTMLKQVTKGIVIDETGTAFLIKIISAIAVVMIVSLFAYLSTRKLKKFSPMDAIRNGNNGERFKKKGLLRLSKTHTKTTTFLALNDVFSEFKKYIALFIASIVGIWLVVMPVNTINTLRSENLIDWFGMQRSDVFMVDDVKTTQIIINGDKNKYYEYFDEVKDKLANNGIKVDKIFQEATFRLKIRKDDQSFTSVAFQGIGTNAKDYVYEEGTYPEYENEVAITYMVAEKIGANIGDTVYITCGEEEKPYVVTAFYQSMNNLGEGIRFNETAELDYKLCAGTFGLQIRFAKDYSKKELLDIIDKIETIFPDASVEMTKEYISEMVGGVSDRLADLKMLILAVVIFINILVVVLMQKMFLIREKGEMGMLKAMGFSNKSIITWQTKRVALVLICGILVGTLTGTPFSQITSGQVFKIMGASKIVFEINPIEVYVIYPVSIFVATVIACVITMHKVRNISVSEINNIE